MERDKKLHLGAGAAIAALVLVLTHSLHAASAAVFVAAAGKELYDWLANRIADWRHLPRPHSVESLDILYTLGGGLLVLLPFVIAGAAS